MQNIGVIDYLGYRTLIIINDFERKQGKATIYFKQGWVNLTKFQNDFIAKNKESEDNNRQICDWGRTKTNKDLVLKLLERSADLLVAKVSLKGGNNTIIDV